MTRARPPKGASVTLRLAASLVALAVGAVALIVVFLLIRSTLG